MRIYFLTYSDEFYAKSRDFCAWTAKHIGGFDEIIISGPQDLDESFKKKNASILSYKRGVGLWLWKPYVILKTLKKLNNGDILFYSDAGACFIRSARKIIESMQQDIWCCDIPTVEEQFTKAACFTALDCVGGGYSKSCQRIATFFAIRKSAETMDFVTKWLEACENIDLIYPEERSEENPLLLSHREDQSIFSLLTKKYGFKSHKIPTAAYYYPKMEQWRGCKLNPQLHNDDDYNACIYLHKQKTVSLKKYFLNSIYVRLPRFIMDYIAKKKGFVCIERFYAERT